MSSEEFEKIVLKFAGQAVASRFGPSQSSKGHTPDVAPVQNIIS